jgi:hypothetical protein
LQIVVTERGRRQDQPADQLWLHISRDLWPHQGPDGPLLARERPSFVAIELAELIPIGRAPSSALLRLGAALLAPFDLSLIVRLG